MPDTNLSTHVILSGGGSITVSGVAGTVPVPTAGQIANAQAAIDAMTSDIDSFLTDDVTVYLVPQSFFEARNWTAAGKTAWGFTPVKGKAFVNNGLGDNKQQYTILHEIFHTIDSAKGVMNNAKRATVGALMRPAPDQSIAGWWGKGYVAAPNENAADAFPQAYAGIGDLTGDFYTAPIPPSSFGAYRTAVGGAGAPASTTLAADATAGATNIKVASVTDLHAGDWTIINGVETHQLVTVGTSGSGGTGLTLDSPLTGSYTTGQSVVETGAPSGVSSGDVDIVVTATTANGQLASYTVTGLVAGSRGTVKIRFYDGTAWGPWSDEVGASADGEPGPAINITVESGTLTPQIGFSINSYPGDRFSWYEIVVGQYLNGNLTVLWDYSQDVTDDSSRIQVEYAGAPLAWDQSYLLNISYRNRNGASGGLAAAFFTPTLDAGPVITYLGDPLTTDYKIGTLTPTFRLAHRAGVNIDEARLRLWDISGTTLVWDSGLTGPFTAALYKDITVDTGYLTWGMNLKVDGLVRRSGSTDPDSYSVEKYSVHLNAAPGRPFPVSVTSDTGQVVLRSDGVWVTTDDTPDIVFPFRDVDLDLGYLDEEPTRQEVEVRDSDLVAFGSSPYVDSSSPSETFTSPTLDLEGTFDFRARYDDTASVRSDWSERIFVKYSAAPTLSAVTPADLATVTDPTETIAWTYASNGGKPRAAYQLVGLVDGAVIYDSGVVASDDDSADFPPFTLPNATDVTWRLTVWDTDGLWVTLERIFTTSFTQPDAVTGLTLTADTDRKALLVEWDESTLPDEEFYSYIVYAKSRDDQFRAIATLFDKTTTSLYYRAAGHNVESVVYVTQSNGWQESEPAIESATLGGAAGTSDELHGYWDVGLDGAYELKHIKHGPGDTQVDIEQFAPPGRRDENGRREKILLTWGATRYEGTFSLFTDDRELVRRLRRYKDRAEVRLFKTPYGSSRYVRFTSVPDTDLPARWINATVTYIEIYPESAAF